MEAGDRAGIRGSVVFGLGMCLFLYYWVFRGGGAEEAA